MFNTLKISAVIIVAQGAFFVYLAVFGLLVPVGEDLTVFGYVFIFRTGIIKTDGEFLVNYAAV